MKIITEEFLKSHHACSSGMEWVKKNKLIGLESFEFLDKLMDADKFSWANWLVVRLMDKPQKVKYAIFAAEQVIDIFEKKYPNDNRPRKAIEAAKGYLKSPTTETKAAAYAAYAADAAYAAYAAATYAAATYAADAAAAAYAAAATYAADAAAYAAVAAAYAAAADAASPDARKELQLRILNYGKELIKEP